MQARNRLGSGRGGTCRYHIKSGEAEEKKRLLHPTIANETPRRIVLNRLQDKRAVSDLKPLVTGFGLALPESHTLRQYIFLC